MSDWVAYKTAVDGLLQKQEVEYQFALANAFTICDAYHCAMHAGTNPNRKFIWTGTNGPTGAGVASVVNEFDGIYHQQKVMNGRLILSVYSKLA